MYVLGGRVEGECMCGRKEGEYVSQGRMCVHILETDY